MFKWVLGTKSNKDKTRANVKADRPTYEDAKRIARDGDVQARRALAAHEDLEPEFLYYFASDSAAEVRRAVAENPGTPLQADVILADDVDEEVRCDLARKIGRLVPKLTPEENKALTEMALDVVRRLARDDLPRVRATLAEEIKLADNMPKALIRRLADDVEDIVSAPVLEYSPLLTDEDLLEILTSGPRGRRLVALARRRELADKVSRAIAGTRDVDAVVALLKNATATIGEETIADIADIAETIPEWHEPLADREQLPIRIVLRIANFVNSALVDVLLERNRHLDLQHIEEIKATVRRRIARGDFAQDEDAWEPAEDRARRLHEHGELTEEILRQALSVRDIAFIRHSLVFMSGLPQDVVQKILNTRSAKGVVALSWKARLSMDLCEILQQKIARIEPRAMLHAKPDGSYPLTDGDIEWYLDFYL